MLQSASLVFAGDAVALNLAFREEAARATLAIWLVVVSAVYLGTALGATLYVDKLGPRHVLSLEDVLPRRSCWIQARRRHKAKPILESGPNQPHRVGNLRRRALACYRSRGIGRRTACYLGGVSNRPFTPV